MNINEEIGSEVWESLSSNYLSGNYSKAVEDAFFSLTKTLRSVTGDTGDGVRLVKKALTGDNPSVLLNDQITQSEIDYQKGIGDIAVGMYSAIRNPLVHEKLPFTKEEADIYICIINFLIEKIQTAHRTFDLDEILDQLKDPMYATTAKYSKSLVIQIAKNRYIEVLNVILDNRTEIPFDNIASFLPVFLSSAMKKDEKMLYRNISRKLGKSSVFNDLRLLVVCIPSTKWELLDDSTRIRVEHIILNDMHKGTLNVNTEKLGKFGALSTWVELELLKAFENIDDVRDVIIGSLKSDNLEAADFAKKYFLTKLFELEESNPHPEFIEFIREEFTKEKSDIISYMHLFIYFDETHPWRTTFQKEIEVSSVDFSPFN